MADTELEMVTLTDKQKQSRRNRSVALAIVLVALVGIFYAVTVLKFGAAIMQRPM